MYQLLGLWYVITKGGTVKSINNKQSPHFVEYQEVSAVDSPTKKAADLFDRHAVSTVVSSGEINRTIRRQRGIRRRWHDRARTHLELASKKQALVDDTASHTKATRTWKKNLTPAQNPTDRDASDYVTSIAVTKTKASWLELLSFLIGGEYCSVVRRFLQESRPAGVEREIILFWSYFHFIL